MEASAGHRTRSSWSPVSLFLIAALDRCHGRVTGLDDGRPLVAFGVWFFGFAACSLPGA